MLIPLVGAYHVPPATTLLKFLPEGTELVLWHETTNPYDDQAIRVGVDVEAQVPAARWPELEQALDQGFAMDRGELEGPPTRLGFLAKPGNKDIAKLGAATGERVESYAVVWERWPDPALWPATMRATLETHATGAPMVRIERIEPVA